MVSSVFNTLAEGPVVSPVSFVPIFRIAIPDGKPAKLDGLYLQWFLLVRKIFEHRPLDKGFGMASMKSIGFCGALGSPLFGVAERRAFSG